MKKNEDIVELSNLRIRNDFSRVAYAYKKYRLDYPEHAYELINEFCPQNDSKVLDIGCGTGIVTRHLAKYYSNVIGVDKEFGMLKIAQNDSSKGLVFIRSLVENLPFCEGTFDLITVGTAYHWFDYTIAGKEIYRVLKSTGKLCVFSKNAREDGSKAYLPLFAYHNLLKFIPEIPKANKEPIGENTFSRVGFSNVVNKIFDFDEVYSKEEILGYLESHSTFNLLDENQKKEYMKKNEESVSGQLVGGKYVFKSRMNMWFVSK